MLQSDFRNCEKKSGKKPWMGLLKGEGGRGRLGIRALHVGVKVVAIACGEVGELVGVGIHGFVVLR